MITTQQLAKATGAQLNRAELWLPHIVSAMTEFDIVTPQRQVMFLAQIGHESCGLHYSAEIWGPTHDQLGYERDFASPWPSTPEEAHGLQFAANRKAFTLGNDAPGDGFKYRGRGLIEITGKGNYRTVSAFFSVDFVMDPELLGEDEYSARSAAWFWKWHHLNEMADEGDFYTITKRINGGLNGIENRKALLQAASDALGVSIA